MMRNNLFLLTRILLKGGGTTLAARGKRKREWVMPAVLAAAFAPIVVELAHFTAQVYDILAGFRMQGIIPGLTLTMSALIIFFFGLFYILNTFYFASDIEILLPLPLRPSEILGAKLIVVTVYEYLTELVVLAPALVVYGIKSGAGPVYYIYAAVVFLLLPLTPLFLDSVIIMPVMRFSGLAKNKDQFKFAGGLIALFVGLGFNFLFQRVAGGALTTGQLQSSLSQLKPLVITTGFLPGLNFAASALLKSSSLGGVTGILLFLAASAAVVALFLFLGEILYFKGAMGVSEASSKRRKITGAELDRKAVQNHVIKTYLMKELKLLFRTPAYFINCVLMNFLWPLFLLLPFLAHPNGMKQLLALSRALQSPHIAGVMLAGCFGAVLFITSSNGVTSTCISREGQNLYITKYIPVSYKGQLMAKALAGVLTGLAGMLMLIVTAAVMLKMPAGMPALLVAAGLPAILFSSFSGILLDLFNPKLNWDTEQKAVKQNMNLMINMLVGVVLGGLTVFAVLKLDLTPLTALAAILAFYGLIDLALYFVLATRGVALFRRLE